MQEMIGCSMDNWDATFSEQWTCSDLVDCIISYAVTKIVEKIAIDGAPLFEVHLLPSVTNLKARRKRANTTEV